MQTHSVPLLTFNVSDYSSSNKISRYLASSLGYRSTRTENGSYTCLIKEVIVLCGNYTTGNHYNILTAQLLELFDNLRNQCLVSGSQ